MKGNNKDSNMILAGDIGGTKTTLALFEVSGNILELKVKHQFASKEYISFDEVLKAFKLKTSISKIEAACVGIAGPIIDGRCRTTNLSWNINVVDLQKQLHIDKIHLMNDLEATAYGMLYLSEDEFVDLNPDGRPFEGNRAVMAAGTGLGEAMLYYDGNNYHPIRSEGGHSDFASVTVQQDALLKWLRDRYAGHVSYERILSGPGIHILYEFLHDSGFAPEPANMMHIAEGNDPSEMVSKCALNERDPLCLEALRLFAEIYGAEAGNLALKSMSLGGVYIGGGIAPKILSVLTDKHFMNAFLGKGRFEELLRGMQVRISLNPETALLGAAHFAQDRL